MSGIAYYPPTTYFQNINFNNDFYAIPNNNQGISLAYANTHYLFSTGVATSTAITTYFSGSVGIGTIGGTAGTLNALTLNAITSIQINGNDISNIYDKITDRQSAITSLSNVLQANINTKQDILTASTSLLGIGSSITQLNYNNISNPPNLSVYDLITDRQSAITSLSNVLQANINTKQNILTAATSLLGIGSSITQLNYNNISNPPNLSVYDLITDRKTAITSLSNSLNTKIDTNLTISSNYTSNTSNILNSKIDTYPTSNVVKNLIIYDTPQVNKKNAFYCQTTNIIYPNGGGTAYYAYHIDLRNYTKTGFIQIGSGSGDTYRIFKIRGFFGSSYFQKLTNGIPDIFEYTVYMSNKAAAGGDGTIAGINIMATGIPQNYFLNNIMNNNLFLLRNANNNFDYMSVVSPVQADIRVFIEDMLN